MTFKEPNTHFNKMLALATLREVIPKKIKLKEKELKSVIERKEFMELKNRTNNYITSKLNEKLSYKPILRKSKRATITL